MPICSPPAPTLIVLQVSSLVICCGKHVFIDCCRSSVFVKQTRPIAWSAASSERWLVLWMKSEGPPGGAGEGLFACLPGPGCVWCERVLSGPLYCWPCPPSPGGAACCRGSRLPAQRVLPSSSPLLPLDQILCPVQLPSSAIKPSQIQFLLPVSLGIMRKEMNL